MEILSFYYTVNGIIGNARNRAILLSSVGPPTFRLGQSLALPASLDIFSYDDLMSKVRSQLLSLLSDVFSSVLATVRWVNQQWNTSPFYVRQLNTVTMATHLVK